MSNSLRPHGSQHARPPCPSPTPGVYSNSCPLTWWCYPIISSSVIPFSSRLQSFPASGSFQMSQFFVSGGQNIGVSASTLVLTEVKSRKYHKLDCNWIWVFSSTNFYPSHPCLFRSSGNSFCLLIKCIYVCLSCITPALYYRRTSLCSVFWEFSCLSLKKDF